MLFKTNFKIILFIFLTLFSFYCYELVHNINFLTHFLGYLLALVVIPVAILFVVFIKQYQHNPLTDKQKLTILSFLIITPAVIFIMIESLLTTPVNEQVILQLFTLKKQPYLAMQQAMLNHKFAYLYPEYLDNKNYLGDYALTVEQEYTLKNIIDLKVYFNESFHQNETIEPSTFAIQNVEQQKLLEKLRI